MNSFKRQVSPGAAVFLVVLVLAIVQWVWWRGLVYKPPSRGGGPAGGGPPAAAPSLTLEGHKYVKVETEAGDIEPGDADGPGYAARFDRPTGIALDRAGTLYVCDTGNHRIRAVAVNGSVTTFAGRDQGFADGPAEGAKFNAPCGICVSPDGAIYVADTGNGKIRCIRNGQVTTLIQQGVLNNLDNIRLPVAVAYQAGPVPSLLVLDAGLKRVSLFDTSGRPRGTAAVTESVVISGDAAGSVYKSEIPAIVQIDGTEELQSSPNRPVVSHLYGWCRIGSGSLLTDSAHGAVFYKKSDSADVLAGFVNSSGPFRGWRDGNGENCQFGTITSVVSDGVRYAYVADTSNNCIRRLTLPEFMFH